MLAIWPTLTTLLVAGSLPEGQTPPASQDAAIKELMELLNTPVTSATKTAGMTGSEAPAIVRVLTEAEIRDQGFQSLHEILLHAAGIEMEFYRSAHAVAWVRGVQTRYNSKVLLLIDGVPIRDGYLQNYNFANILPASMIKRVEITNGPGSVLYGSGAFAGVVSVTTRKVGREASVAAGSFQGREIQAAWDHVEATSGFSIQARHRRTDGWDPDFSVDGIAWDHPQEARDSHLLIKGWTGGWTFQGGLLASDYPDAYREGSAGGRRDRMIENKPWFASLRYEGALPRDGTFRISAFHESFAFTRHEMRFSPAGVPNRMRDWEYSTEMTGLDGDVAYSIGAHQLLFGVSHLIERADGLNETTVTLPSGARSIRPLFVDAKLNPIDHATRTSTGIFAQDLWRLSERLTGILGIRYDTLSDFDSQVNLRLGLTGNMGNYFGKALFGTAYRTPSNREMIDSIAYNFSLKPEKIQTLEVQGGRRWGRGQATLTLYRNHYTDFIKELYATGAGGPGAYRPVNDEYALNADSRTILGAELDTTFTPMAGLTLNLNLSHIFKAEESLPSQDPLSPSYVDVDQSIGLYHPGTQEATFLSRTMANALATYRFDSGLTAGLSLHYRSARSEVPARFQSGVPAASRNPSVPEGFLTIGGNLRWSRRGLSLSLSGSNLTDRKIFSPAIVEEHYYGLQWVGRVLRMEVGYRF